MIDLMKRSSTALIVFGLLATTFGLIAAFFPVGTVLTLVLLWGIYALIDGVTAAVLAFSGDARQSRGFLVFAAVVGIAAGMLAILQPLTSAVALAWVAGTTALVVRWRGAEAVREETARARTSGSVGSCSRWRWSCRRSASRSWAVSCMGGSTPGTWPRSS